MEKMNKIKKRILSMVLSCAVMVSFFVGIMPMEVKAANFYPPIIDTDSIVLYESGCLKEITITVQTSGSYGAAYGRIGVHNGTTSYDWDNRFISSGCTTWPDESKFKAKDPTFLTFANGNQFEWTDQKEHRVTVGFDDGEVDLSHTGTYYIYLWTISDQYGIYTDALIGTLGTEDGVLKDSNGNILIDSSTTTPEVETYTITLDRTNYADGYVELYTYDSEGNNVADTQENNATITMPEGGSVKIFADSEFTVTATGATVGEMQAAGEEGYYYVLTGIAADTTVVVNKVTTPVVTAPIITGQPQNVSVQEGQKATFSVTATGDNLSYQWQTNRNDGNGFVNLSGATSASYMTSTVDMDCNGFKYQCIVSNEGGSVTTNIATLTVTESTSVHTHSLTLVPAKAATCTETGNKAYYTCSGCDSLFADANGTTITTAEAVKIAALDHDWIEEWVVIKEATATEDGKKETLCTRGCGQKKVAIIPATGTTDDNSNLEKDAEVAPDAPIDEATLNNSKEELLEAGNIFKDAEKTQIANGADARVWLEIGKTDKSAIASTDEAKIKQEATKIMGDNLSITYFDVALFQQVGTNKKNLVPEPGIAIKITITIPDELINTDKTVSREYKIIRLHEGQVDVINGTFNATTGEFTFESDKFSTYAIVYKDVLLNDDDDNSTSADTDVTNPEDDKRDEAPNTGDSNTTLYSFVLMVLSGLGIIICSRKKEILNKES